MKLGNSFIPANSLVSSPFVRWQGSLAEVSSIDLAVSIGKSVLSRSRIPIEALSSVVLGWTVPQPAIFYGAPWVAARIGATGISGPMVSQACATAVACLQSAASVVQADARAAVLAIATDRTSNGPSLLFPAPSAAGGSPVSEHWVLDNFRRDPWTEEAMISTAEHVARDCQASREELDDLTQLRFEQYQSALAEDRRLQRRYMVGIDIQGPRRSVISIDQDAGVHATTRAGLAALKPVQPDGVMTYGSQTHPADGAAAALVCGEQQARDLARGDGIVQLLATGFARAPAARMPKAATSAAQAALEHAGLSMTDIDCVTTHNPFAVNDLWFSRMTGFDLEKMNPLGCSLIYGHPQAPTGLRAIAELVVALRERGGGTGLFTGCAAGDTGAALVVRVS